MNIIFSTNKLTAFINEWIAENPVNKFNFAGSEGQTIWEPPLISFADGNDELFSFLKKDIGDFYWLPSEAFTLKYPNTSFEHLSIMSLAFPHTEKTKQDQRESSKEPSARWRYSRKHWPEFMQESADYITDYLTHLGIRSVVPDLLPAWGFRQSEKYGYASNWSQRHTAYVAGMGTFGLSDGLITAHGKAVRFISIIIEANIKPTKRTYVSYHEWCLNFNNGSCGLCMKRCPVGAITPLGHDKEVCSAYTGVLNKKYILEGEGAVGCGLCQTGVPCENKRPSV